MFSTVVNIHIRRRKKNKRKIALKFGIKIVVDDVDEYFFLLFGMRDQKQYIDSLNENGFEIRLSFFFLIYQ